MRYKGSYRAVFKQSIAFKIAKIILFIASFALVYSSSERVDAAGIREPIDIVLVIDDSGSMYSEFPGGGSDPEALRYAAARLILDLATPGDRIGLVSYAQGAKQVGEFITVTNRPSDLDALRNAATEPAQGAQTCMNKGLAIARDLLRKVKEEGRPQAIIFLTDGNFTCNSTIGTPNDVEQVIRDLQADQVTGFSIILGEETKIDDRFPKLLAQMTGGNQNNAKNAASLIKTFSDIYAMLQPSRYAVSLTQNPANGLFQIDISPEQAVTKIYFVVPHNSILGVYKNENLIDIDGTYISLQSDNHPKGKTSQYDLLKITGNPVSGVWGLDVAGGSVLAVIDAETIPAIDFPVGRNEFSVRYLSSNPKGYLVLPSVKQNSVIQEALKAELPDCGNSQAGPGQIRFASDTGEFDCYVQVGNQVRPLQLIRKYHFVPRNDLPHLEVVVPSSTDPGIQSDGSQRIEVKWTEPDVKKSHVWAIAVDQAGAMQKIDDFQCIGGSCSSQSFAPSPGSINKVYVLATGEADNIIFNDYVNLELQTEGVIKIQGIAPMLEIPTEGLQVPFAVIVKMQEDPGALGYKLQVKGPDLQPTTCIKMVMTPIVLGSSGSFKGNLDFRNNCTEVGIYQGTLEFYFASDSSKNISPNLFGITMEILPPVVPRMSFTNAELVDFGIWSPDTPDITKSVSITFTGAGTNALQVQAVLRREDDGMLLTSNLQLSEAEVGSQLARITLSSDQYAQGIPWFKDRTYQGELRLVPKTGELGEIPSIPFKYKRLSYWSLYTRCDPQIGGLQKAFCYISPFRIGQEHVFLLGICLRSVLFLVIFILVLMWFNNIVNPGDDLPSNADDFQYNHIPSNPSTGSASRGNYSDNYRKKPGIGISKGKSGKPSISRSSSGKIGTRRSIGRPHTSSGIHNQPGRQPTGKINSRSTIRKTSTPNEKSGSASRGSVGIPKRINPSKPGKK